MDDHLNSGGDVIGGQAADIIRAFVQRYPRWPIGTFPSPLRLATSLAGQRFWVKDDGRCSDIYGGNKVRKLEYLLAEVQRNRQKVLVVHGDMESHTVQACCILGNKAALEVHAVVFPHGNQSVNCSELTFLRRLPIKVHVQRTMLGSISKAHWIAWRRQGFVVPLGASAPIATAGYIQAALELDEQIRVGSLPVPRTIYLPFATGGSVAGLLIGLAAAGLETRVVAVQTVDGIIANQRRLERLIRKTLAVLGTDQDFFRQCLERLEVIDGQNLGSGYRDVPPAVAEAVDVARQHGLNLEPVFSGKAFAALLDALPQFPDGELLFWNTHDQHNLPMESEARK